MKSIFILEAGRGARGSDEDDDHAQHLNRHEDTNNHDHIFLSLLKAGAEAKIAQDF